MKVVMRAVAVMVISIAAVCLIFVPSSSALSLSGLLNDVTAPITRILGNDESESPPPQQPSSNPEKPVTPAQPTDPDPAEPATSESPVPPPVSTTTAEPDSTPLAAPEKDTISQIAPLPNATVTEQTSRRIPASSAVLASILTLESHPTRDPAVQRTPEGWKLGGVLWYWWISIIAALVLVGISLKYQWSVIFRKVTLSKK